MALKSDHWEHVQIYYYYYYYNILLLSSGYNSFSSMDAVSWGGGVYIVKELIHVHFK